MNLIEACKTGKKFRRPEWNKEHYWIYKDGEIQTYYGYVVDHVTFVAALADDYELYTPEIRPKEAGEFWVNTDGNVVFIHEHSQLEGLMATELSGFRTSKYKDLIHGQSGWKRVYPPVEDCERVEISFIGCHDETGSTLIKKDGNIIDYWENKGKLIFIPNKEEG